MTQVVSNPSADSAEKVEHAAKILRASKHAKNVFKLVYRGKRGYKTVDDMRQEIRGFNTNTYVAANRLAAENILEKKRHQRRDVYYKISFYTHNRDRILRLSENSKRLKLYPTKRKTSVNYGKTTFIFHTKPQVQQLSVDDFDSFKNVRSISSGNLVSVKKMAERKINRGICNILTQGEKKDWGGERNDIFSTRVKINGKRTVSSFALKGKGTKGTLTPKKMGKNGDQISRLFEGTAVVHFVVHNDSIQESILDLMQTHAIRKSIETGKKIFLLCYRRRRSRSFGCCLS